MVGLRKLVEAQAYWRRRIRFPIGLHDIVRGLVFQHVLFCSKIIVCSLLLEVADPSVSKVLHSVGIQWND